MNKRLQHKQKIYKRLNDDIWGKLAVSTRYSKALQHVAYHYVNSPENRALYTNAKLRKFFIWKKDGRAFINWLHQARNSNINFSYNLKNTDTEQKSAKITARTRAYWSGIKVKKYYGDKRQKQFKFFKKQITPRRRLAAPGILSLLETRLDTILYRTNLFGSVYELRQYINHKKILVNGVITHNQSTTINVGDVVSLKPELYASKYKHLLTKLKADQVLTNYPPYLEINYKIGCVLLARQPRPEEVTYPFKRGGLTTATHSYTSVMN